MARIVGPDALPSRRRLAEDRDGLVAPLHEALQRGDPLNLYMDMKTAGSIGLGHRSAWGRTALLTDKDWIRHGASAFGWLSPGELKIFEPDEHDAALTWVASGLER